MTKRDGDKLRDWQAECSRMAHEYGPNSLTGEAALLLRHAMQCALMGRRFEVVETVPRHPVAA